MFAGGALIAAVYLDLFVALMGAMLCYLCDRAEMKVCAATLRARDNLDGDTRLQDNLLHRLLTAGSASTAAVVLMGVGATLTGPQDLRDVPILFLVAASLYWAVCQHQLKSVVRARSIIIGAGVLAILAAPLAASMPPLSSPMWPKALTAVCVFYFIHVCARGYAAGYNRALDQMASVRAALDETERSARHKSDLLRILSHELRTPLNGVMGMAELMRLGELSEAQKSQLGTIRTSAGRLDELIDQVMDSEHLEAGRLRIVKAPVALSDVIEPVIERHRKSAEEKGLTLRLATPSDHAGPTPKTLVMDGDRVGRCLDHLISNAVKFTETGGVTISAAHTARPGPPILSLVVTDTGIGMSAETLASIFQRFSQDNMTEARSYGGVGLGLWISRVSAELMGGDLTVVSAPGAGSTFTLTLIAEEARNLSNWISAQPVAQAG